MSKNSTGEKVEGESTGWLERTNGSNQTWKRKGKCKTNNCLEEHGKSIKGKLNELEGGLLSRSGRRRGLNMRGGNWERCEGVRYRWSVL